MENVTGGELPLFIAHNGLRFDVPVLLSSFRRAELSFPLDSHFLDTLPLAQLVLPKNSEKHPHGPKNHRQASDSNDMPYMHAGSKDASRKASMTFQGGCLKAMMSMRTLDSSACNVHALQAMSMPCRMWLHPMLCGLPQ